GTNFKISESGQLGSNDRFTIATGGNIGIGTTSPASRLTVTGDVFVSESITANPGSARNTSAVNLTLDPASSFTSNINAFDVNYNLVGSTALTGGNLMGVSSYINSNSSANNNLATLYGGDFYVEQNQGTIGQIRGISATGYVNFGTTSDSVYGTYTEAINAGGVVSGNLYGLYVYAEGAAGGNRYGVYENAETGSFNYFKNSVGIGTTSPTSLLTMDNTGVTAAGVMGLTQYYESTNSTLDAVQLGGRSDIVLNNTATSTLVGDFITVTDSTTLGNTVRGFEVQADRGGNTQGENTALSGFARTFGVRAFTSADAGGSFEPAAGYFELGGTGSQGNAIRAYSETITTTELLSLFQASSTFTGTGLLMNFGNDDGNFSSTSSKFVDFQNAGTSKFTVEAHGTTTIGDGTTNYMASLHIGYGGLCVDNDGSCTATTTGRISSVSSYQGNSDLAEQYFSSQALEPGELVVSDSFISIERAVAGSEQRVLGVVSTKPGLLIGADDTSLVAGQQGYPLALTGRVPVVLSDENGPIAIGDPLTLSSVPGVAMKATGAAEIVGYALEAFDGTRAYTEG
ncbi:MAG TPA: hypothetical protein VKP88_05130, partial [Candidatus Paceibacterota bacterium]|nr:hypothetical protein [Candidatus Paceibacterota bacterium]